MSDDRSDLDEAIDILRNWKGIMPCALVERINRLLARHPEKPTLLPCPFCGGRAEVVGPRAEREFFAICKSCECMTQDAVSAEQAAAAWNRRASSPDLVCALGLLKEYLNEGAIPHDEVIDLVAKYPATPVGGPLSGGKTE